MIDELVGNLEGYQEHMRAKINDMLCRIASLEDKVRELYYLIEEVQKKLED